MKPSKAFEFPPDKARLMARARRLEWWSLAYLVVATLVVALVLGQSQAMKTAWLDDVLNRSEEHTSELQSLMRISYAVFCLKKKKNQHKKAKKQPNSNKQ